MCIHAGIPSLIQVSCHGYLNTARQFLPKRYINVLGCLNMCVVNVFFFCSYIIFFHSLFVQSVKIICKSTGVFTILTWIRFLKYCIRLIYLIKKKINFAIQKFLKQQINFEYDILSCTCIDISVSHASLKKIICIVFILYLKCLIIS